jgi:hypothetical protein
MHSGRNEFFALVVPAFFCAVVFFVESGYAACDRVFVSARPVLWSGVSEPRGSHPGQPGALKKVPLVNDQTALSEPARTSSRNLAAKEKGAETDARNFRQIAMPTLILAPKISTNLFLSVLNL